MKKTLRILGLMAAAGGMTIYFIHKFYAKKLFNIKK